MNAQRLETSRLLHRFGFGPRPGEYAQALIDGVAATRSKVLTVPPVDAGAATVVEPAITDLELPENFKLSVGHDGLDNKQNWVSSSDHGPFHKQNIPFLYFGVEDHEDYHKPTDDFEKIQPEFYAKAVTVVISVFEKIDAMNL